MHTKEDLEMALFRTSAKFNSVSSLCSFSPVIRRSDAKVKYGGKRSLKQRLLFDLGAIQSTNYGVSFVKCGGCRFSQFKPALCHSSYIHSSSVVSNSTTEKPKNASKEAKRSNEGSVFQQLMKRKEQPTQLTVAGKVLQAGKDFTFLVIVVGGLIFTGVIFYNVIREFVATDSPSVIFTAALKRIRSDPRMVEALGESISGYGEKSGRNRRKHIPHQEYIVKGETYMRLQFFVQGSKQKGTATIDLKKNDRGKYECRFLMVEFPGGTIVVEDNR